VPPDEIVIVDGGSVDGTVAVLEEFDFDGLALQVAVSAGANIAAGRNAGIRLASSDQIALTDAGCRPDPGWLAALEQGLEHSDIVGGVFVRTDVGDPDQVRAAVEAAQREDGDLGLVVLNAGITTGETPIELLDLDRYRTIMAVNVDGVVFGIQGALPALEAAGGGLASTGSAGKGGAANACVGANISASKPPANTPSPTPVRIAPHGMAFCCKRPPLRRRTISSRSANAAGNAGVVALTLTTEASYPEPASSRAPSASLAAASSVALRCVVPCVSSAETSAESPASSSRSVAPPQRTSSCAAIRGSFRRIQELWLPLLAVAIPAVLILKQPDLGTALTYLPVPLIGLFLGGLSWKKALIIVRAGRLLIGILATVAQDIVPLAAWPSVPWWARGAMLANAVQLGLSDFVGGLPATTDGGPPRHVAVVFCDDSHDLIAAATHLRDIARAVGISGTTVYRYLRLDGPPERKCYRARRTPLDPYKEHLLRRWDEGCHVATRLWREIRALGGTS